MRKRLKKECESSVEYTLPDYMGDIKKLLSSRAKAVPSGKFVGEGECEVSGSVEYGILYLDAEDKLTALNTVSDFGVSFPIDGERYIDSAEDTAVNSLKIRVTGPRKISMKSEVAVGLRLSEDTDLAVAGDVFSDEERKIEKCTAEVSFATSRFAKSEEREYADNMERLEGVGEDEAEVMMTSGECVIEETRAGDGEVTVRGENIISALVLLSKNRPIRIKKAIPFEESVFVDGVRAGMNAIAVGRVTSCEAGMSFDSEGLDLVANLTAEYGVEVIENTGASIVTDAYTVDCVCKNEYEKRELSSSAFVGQRRFCVDLRRNKNEEHFGEITEIISMDAAGRLSSAEIENGSLRLKGDVLASGVGYETNVDGSLTYIPMKMQVEFDEKVNLDCQIPANSTIETELKIERCEAISEGDAILVRCHVCAVIYVFDISEVLTLSVCESLPDQVEKRDRSTVTVYYPKKGEKLFDVAKRYMTTAAKIAKDNALTESALSSFDSPDSLAGVRKLIIR